MEGQNNQGILQPSTAVSEVVTTTVAVTAVRVEEYLNNGGGFAPPVDLPAKRKRGRPKKQPSDLNREVLISPELSAPAKRGRGRPKGSGKWQSLAASLGGEAIETVGSGITPHVITIQAGENISQRIWLFSQSISASTFIISASGSVSTADIHLSTFGGAVRYEGRYEIVTLTGSYTNNDMGGMNRKVSLLSVQLATADGMLFGGCVAGLLIAAEPTQLVIASFKQNIGEKPKQRYFVEPPRPNNFVAATSLPKQDKLLANGENPTPHPPPTTDAAHNMVNGSDVNRTSIQPFDWNPTQPSELTSEHMTSDIDTGSTHAQIVSPHEHLNRPPSPYIPLPPSM